MWWPQYVFNLCYFIFWAFSLLCFQSSPPHLCHLCHLPIWITFCVSQLLCVTFCVSQCVCHNVFVTFIITYLSILLRVRWINCVKYCMAHGLCPLAKIKAKSPTIDDKWDLKPECQTLCIVWRESKYFVCPKRIVYYLRPASSRSRSTFNILSLGFKPHFKLLNQVLSCHFHLTCHLGSHFHLNCVSPLLVSF